LGLSGGLDSAVALHLAITAVGPERTIPVFMPYGTMNEKDEGFARRCAEITGTDLRDVDITDFVDSLPVDVSGMALGNAAARARMMILYAIANTEGGFVLGPSNKTELLMGYFTKYGDGASDLAPIGDLFKTQVRLLAEKIGVPEEIIERPPTANLVPGQTDEGEMGMPYPILDQVLNGLIMGLKEDEIARETDCSFASEEEMARSGFEPPLDLEDVKRIKRTVTASRHKRDPLVIPKVGTSTVALDIRERW